MTREPCKLAPVVIEQGCSVLICAHGTLHVSIGSVTLRMHPDCFASIAGTLARASARLAQADASQEPASLH